MLVFLNGSLVPAEQATVSAFDRGFVFGDGVYEGLRAFAGRIRALDDHVARLAGGLREIRLAWDATQLRQIVPVLLGANQLDDAFIYLQVTRCRRRCSPSASRLRRSNGRWSRRARPR